MKISRVVALILSCTCCLSAFTACGKKKPVELLSTTTEVTDPDYSLKNFTPPEIGDEIVILTIKDYGDIKIRLFPEYTPLGVENFVELAKDGYYDGLTFHRVIQDFVMQGGDPTATGEGGESTWGFNFDANISNSLGHFIGSLAYVNVGDIPVVNSQFYIVTGEPYSEAQFDILDSMGYTFEDVHKEAYINYGGSPYLDGNDAVFGQIYEGLDIVFEAQYGTATDPQTDKPYEDLIIEKVTVGTYNGEPLHWYVSDYDMPEPPDPADIPEPIVPDAA